MALKNQNARIVINAGIFLALFVSIFFHPSSSLALGGNTTVLPTFTNFSKTVQNGQAEVLRGVYVMNVLALPVVQQPSSNAGYVSDTDGFATQFSLASKFGNIGLLAHNHLAGKSFIGLAVGQEVRLVYGDGRVEYFVVKEVLKYQALQPTSSYSSFRNLDKDEVLSARQLFNQVYSGDHHVTFQTCIEANGNLSWGRLFIIAVPVEKVISFDRWHH